MTVRVATRGDRRLAGREPAAHRPGGLVAMSVSEASVNLVVVTRTRSSQLGPDARPVAVPDDVADPAIEKAQGEVELPLNLRWSGRPKKYDLTQRTDRIRVYEQVLREGNDHDVRRFIDVDELLELWDDLVLPGRARRAWAEWYRHHRGITLAC